MPKMHKILTPENVNLEFELAGLGSRYIAFFIDFFIMNLLLILISVGLYLMSGNVESTESIDSSYSVETIIVTTIILVEFVITAGYFIFFEIFFNGQSIGKKIMGLKVTSYLGAQIGFFDSLIRNTLRIFDMLPFFNFVGAIFVLFTRNNQRMGDILSHSIVIKIRKIKNYSDEKVLIIKNQNEFGVIIDEDDVQLFKNYIIQNHLFKDQKISILKKLAFYINKKYDQKIELEQVDSFINSFKIN